MTLIIGVLQLELYRYITNTHKQTIIFLFFIQAAQLQDAAGKLAVAEVRIEELQAALLSEQEAHKVAATSASSKDLLSLELSDYQVKDSSIIRVYV